MSHYTLKEDYQGEPNSDQTPLKNIIKELSCQIWMGTTFGRHKMSCEKLEANVKYMYVYVHQYKMD